jgi:phosphoglycerate dehydrogenase-like enzyme
MKDLLLVLDDWEGRIRASSCWKQLDGLVEIKFLGGPLENADSAGLEKVKYLMAMRERTALNEKVFERLPQLKLILQTGGHAYHIDADAAKKRGITVALGRRVKAPLTAVPELTIALMLGLMHKIYQGNDKVKKGEWPLLTGRTLSGRRLGILGLGRHGSRVGHIASTAFGMEVVAWDRTGNSAGNTADAGNATDAGNAADAGNATDAGKPAGVGPTAAFKRLPLDHLLSTSDVVSIHLRLSAESTGLLGREKLAVMKPGAILINTSRGAIIDEQALAEALGAGRLAGAGLDVFQREPLPAGSPLKNLDNVILTPHIGWTVEEVFEEFAQIACTQLIQYLEGTLAKSELLIQ